MIRGRALATLGCATLLALAASGFGGCGDDEEPATTTPTTEPATPTGATGPGATDGENGKDGDADDAVGLDDVTVAPPPETDPENLPTVPAEDGPENDVPPEPGSPAEQFEKFCDANPEACG